MTQAEQVRHDESASMRRRNTWTFGPGSLGRDMAYTLVTMFLIVYLTEVLDLSDAVMWWANAIMLGVRLLDAFLDFAMGTLVDNTRTRWGSYKPWIVAGGILSAVFTICLFTDPGVHDSRYLAYFGLVYLLWGTSWTVNDVPYWSLLPSLTQDPHAREQMSSVAKVFGTFGLFGVVVGIEPASRTLTDATGSTTRAWQIIAAVVVVVMWISQTITLLGVRQPASTRVTGQRVGLRSTFDALRHNDQTMWTALSLFLFLLGYITTSNFGLYFFKYAYRDESQYPVFAAVLGMAQLAGFLTFSLLARVLTRKQIYSLATALLVAAYVAFFCSPMNLWVLGSEAFVMFLAEAWIVLLMIVFLSDTIEYGEWKLGRRSSAVTFALQPLIYKVTAALATAITGATLIVSGINRAATPSDVTPGGLWLMKTVMLLVPLGLICLSYVLYIRHFRIDRALWACIMADLDKRAREQAEGPVAEVGPLRDPQTPLSPKEQAKSYPS